MSQQADWRAGIDDVDAALIDEYQSGFPIAERPFRALADELGYRGDGRHSTGSNGSSTWASSGASARC
ncbi:MAG: hypothetical protein U5K28_11430 [Halobacteriales archaeon]|nr:hypothetical protein [Halobacteriales archaeon]